MTVAVIPYILIACCPVFQGWHSLKYSLVLTGSTSTYDSASSSSLALDLSAQTFFSMVSELRKTLKSKRYYIDGKSMETQPSAVAGQHFLPSPEKTETTPIFF